MIVRYIVEFYAGSVFGGWNQSSDVPFNVETPSQAEELMRGCKARNPNGGFRVSPIEMTEEAFAFQEHRKKLERICDDILRQVVCHCGCYRHHGVGWMPEDSGEGLSKAVEILRKAGL
jgi:hypothetical protein